MQHSLQHVSLTLSQVSKIKRQSIQDFIKNDGFEYGVKCRYTKTLFLKFLSSHFIGILVCYFTNYTM